MQQLKTVSLMIKILLATSLRAPTALRGVVALRYGGVNNEVSQLPERLD